MSEAGKTAVASAPGAGGKGASDPVFPGQSTLPITASWWTSVLVGIGASLLVAVSLAEMAAEIGNVSIWVWIATAFIGALQSLLVAELASRFPGRAGGTPQYAYRAISKGSPTLGALSAWAYWFAWTPGIAVNLIFAAEYFQAEFLPDVNVILIACLIGVVLYFITAFGLKLNAMINAALVAVAVIVVLLIIVTPVLHPGHFSWDNIFPAKLPSEAPPDFWGQLGIIFKWTFIAAWAAYAAEMASTVAAEIRDPHLHMRRVMTLSAIHCFIAFTLVPIVLFGVVGVAGAERDAFEVFGEIGEITLGPAGDLIVGLGLAAVLILGAQIFIIGSSRTIYQMSQDGHLPKFFSKVNRRGAPVGSIVFDATVIVLMLVIFGTDVVEVVAAATFGYLVVFVLLPIAYLTLRRLPGGHEKAFRLGKPWVVVAVLLLIFNTALLLVGGWQWGIEAILVGLGATLAIIPIAYLTRRSRARATGSAS